MPPCPEDEALVLTVSGLEFQDESMVFNELSYRMRSKSLVTVVPLGKVVVLGNDNEAESPWVLVSATRRKSESSPQSNSPVPEYELPKM